jgi:uncharacterized membrane protein YcaP (DUF421 family)
MAWLDAIRWHDVFVPDTPLLEIVTRGTVTYLAIFALLRIVARRQSSQLGMTDVLVIVLISDAAQNAMADDYRSLPDGLVLVAVIIGWSWALDYLAFRFPTLGRWISPKRLPVVENGRLRLDNMRRELLTGEELNSELRKHGVDDIAKVRAAYMEPDGQMSVLVADDSPRPTPSSPRPPSSDPAPIDG